MAPDETVLRKERGELWDSGKISNDQTVNIVYDGSSLMSREQCFWKVCVWDENGNAAWSSPASWSLGLLNTNDWRPRFISYRDTTPVHDWLHRFRRQSARTIPLSFMLLCEACHF